MWMTAILRQILRRKWAVLAPACVLALGMAAVPAGALAAPGPQRLAISGSHPAWAAAADGEGQVPAGTVISARVYLAGRDPAGLASYAAEVSSPRSAMYGRYLTPAQYQRHFGPTAAQVSAVRRWLIGAGLRVTAVTPHYVAFSGSEAAIPAAFGTTLRYYRVAGSRQRAPQSLVTVPAAVSSAVLTVVGLATGSAKMQTEISQQDIPLPKFAPVNLGACSLYWDQLPATGLPPAYGGSSFDYTMCGYVPHQLRNAYGIQGSGLTGKGVTIAIVDAGASPTIVSDVNTYMGRYGEPPLRPGQLTQYLPSDLSASCGTTPAPYGEEALDIEAAHGMAPDANIAFVAADCSSIQDPLDALTEIVDGHLADIVSNSWLLGTEAQLPAGLVPAFEQVFEEGAVEGIGFYFSSGDHGDLSPYTSNGLPAVQYPASDPWVTAVGGTSLATDAKGNYRWETGWGDYISPLIPSGTSWAPLPGLFYGGAGGGPSSLFTQPFYQSGIVPASLSEPAGSATAMRVIPDIAADADPATGMLIGLTTPTPTNATAAYNEEVVGGTSESTPLIAGIQADAEQALGFPIGYADPAIYFRYGTSAYHVVTADPLGAGVTITSVVATPTPVPAGQPPYVLATLGEDTGLRVTPGYNPVTGVGTPTARYLSSYYLAG